MGLGSLFGKLFGGGSKPKRTAPARVTRPPPKASKSADAPTTAAPRPAPQPQPSPTAQTPAPPPAAAPQPPAAQAPAPPPVAEPQAPAAQAPAPPAVADSPTVTREAAPGPAPVAPPGTPAPEAEGAQDVASLLGGSVVPQGGTMIMGAVSADAPGAPQPAAGLTRSLAQAGWPPSPPQSRSIPDCSRTSTLETLEPPATPFALRRMQPVPNVVLRRFRGPSPSESKKSQGCKAPWDAACETCVLRAADGGMCFHNTRSAIVGFSLSSLALFIVAFKDGPPLNLPLRGGEDNVPLRY